MTTPCRRAACDTGCLPSGVRTVGRFTRARRWAAAAAALLLSIPLVAVVALLPGRGRLRRILWVWSRRAAAVLRALGVRVEVDGAVRSGPSLVVGNHVSFLDILVLSSVAPMRMVAKSEVGRWPVVGSIARLTGSVFVRRAAWSQLPTLVDEIAVALRRGYRVQVFPEGTTRCGDALDPFRRAAFQAAIDAAVVVTPITLAHTVGGSRSAAAAFLGEETVLDCVRRVVATAEVAVQVRVLRPIPAIAGTGRAAVDRRVVAALAERAVARDLRLPVRRPAPTPTPSPELRVPVAPRPTPVPGPADLGLDPDFDPA